MTTLPPLDRLYEILKYSFQNKGLIQIALTHSSYANEAKRKMPFNERLEFLGDSVLGLIVSDYLYKAYPDMPEGVLSKIRAGVVSEVSLAQIARELNLGVFLFLGKGEENIGGRDRTSVLANAMESVIGAMYLDSNLDAVKKFVLRLMIPAIEIFQAGKGTQDYKTELQELLQSQSAREISYRIIKTEGPDHDRWFTADVCHGEESIGRGEGKSKKEAEQQAAQNALKKLLTDEKN